MGNVKIVSASAGSGKTYNLAYEYVRNVVSDPSLYKHILAVTFTNKATEEMKRRILAKINELANGDEHDYAVMLIHDLHLPLEDIKVRAKVVRGLILHDYGNFAVLTIDKFFQRIIRSFIKELGIDLNFNLELPVETLLGSATDRMIDDLSDDDELREWVEAFVDDRMEDGRKWDIRGELLSLGGELFKEDYKRGRSGLGGDKEALRKMVTSVCAAAAKAEKNIAAAARHIIDIMSDNGLVVSDFSYGAKGVAGYICKVADGEIVPYTKRVSDALEGGKWYAAKSAKKEQIEELTPVLTQALSELVKLYDASVILMNNAALIKENYRSFGLLADLQARVEAVSKEENIVHISEINDMLGKLVSGNDTPFVFEKAGNYFSHFMIDEFQDTSAMQWNNFLPLLRNATSQSGGSPVLLVGDVKQSIYRWRGGDWSILAHKAGGAFNAVTYSTLQNNYRSRHDLVKFINAIIGACVAAEDIKVNAMLDSAIEQGFIGDELYGELYGIVGRAYADYEQYPVETNVGGYVTVTSYSDEPPVVQMVEELQDRGYAAGDIAILVRYRSEASHLAAMLLERKETVGNNGYCYDVVTQDALVLGKAPVVNFIVACMKLACNRTDAISRTIYNRARGNRLSAELSDDDNVFLGRLALMSPEEAFENIVMHYALGNSDEEIAYMQALHEQVLSFSKSNVADIPLFVSWWEESGSTSSIPMPSGGNAITIDTVHKSKGLGYRAVIIPYCSWSLLPKTNSIIWAEQDGDASNGKFPVNYKKVMANSQFASGYYREYVMSQVDNINLFYVALTRAREELHVMMPMPVKSSAECVNGLLDCIMMRNGDNVSIGNIVGRIEPFGDGLRMEFGKPSEQNERVVYGNTSLLRYDTTDMAGRIAVRFDAQRYGDEGVADDRLSPRNYGVLLHKVFEQSADMDDVHTRIKEMCSDGGLSEREMNALETALAQALENDTVQEWFDGTWEVVRNENDILIPGGKSYRPDRVMIKEGMAVVVDYKFGLHRLPMHARQVQRYMSLLRSMGYSVSGYVWYVSLGDVEPVTDAD